MSVSSTSDSACAQAMRTITRRRNRRSSCINAASSFTVASAVCNHSPYCCHSSACGGALSSSASQCGCAITLSCTKSLNVSTDFACTPEADSGNCSAMVCQYCCNSEESGFIKRFLVTLPDGGIPPYPAYIICRSVGLISAAPSGTPVIVSRCATRTVPGCSPHCGNVQFQYVDRW